MVQYPRYMRSSDGMFFEVFVEYLWNQYEFSKSGNGIWKLFQIPFYLFKKFFKILISPHRKSKKTVFLGVFWQFFSNNFLHSIILHISMQPLDRTFKNLSESLYFFLIMPIFHREKSEYMPKITRFWIIL